MAAFRWRHGATQDNFNSSEGHKFEIKISKIIRFFDFCQKVTSAFILVWFLD
eukprot:m.26281 g.26281  ORF g.26281 m.26281 type:complete len:52 (-) comp7780_c0_seq1:144-299(-)